MAAKTYNLNFIGYKWEKDLPQEAGVYLTYTVKYNSNTNEYNIDKLVYIGESQDIKGRQVEHLADGDYPQGAKLAYAYALVSGGEDNRKRCEAALIFKVKPEWNTANKQSFSYDSTTVISIGEHYGVPAELIVSRSI